MKKWGILGLVVLGGLILGLQYYINRGEKKPGLQTQPGPGDQIGVALPPGATGYVPPDSSYTGVTGSYNDISLPSIATAYKGACPGGSPADILAAHGKSWGYSVPKTSLALELKESDVIYNLMGNYTRCVAASRADASLCDALPAEVKTDRMEIPLDFSLYTQCRKKTINLLFLAFQAGTVKDDQSCRLGLSSWDRDNLEKASVPEWCGVLSKGPESSAPFAAKIFSQEVPDAAERAAKAARTFPAKEKDCGGNSDCLEQYRFYRALKNGRPQDCPREYSPHCAALLGRSPAPCDALLQDMSKAYCAAAERIKKKSGGYFGVTKEELEADIKQKELQKKAEALQKIEDEKLLLEINKKAKKLLGKE